MSQAEKQKPKDSVVVRLSRAAIEEIEALLWRYGASGGYPLTEKLVEKCRAEVLGAERGTPNPEVAGSIPALPAMFGPGPVQDAAAALREVDALVAAANTRCWKFRCDWDESHAHGALCPCRDCGVRFKDHP